MEPCREQREKRRNNAECNAAPPCLRKYGETLSEPSAVLRLNDDDALITSSSVYGIGDDKSVAS